MHMNCKPGDRALVVRFGRAKERAMRLLEDACVGREVRVVSHMNPGYPCPTTGAREWWTLAQPLIVEVGALRGVVSGIEDARLMPLPKLPEPDVADSVPAGVNLTPEAV